MAARRFPWKWLVILALLVAAVVYVPKLFGGAGDAPAADGQAMGAPPVSVAKALGKSVVQWSSFSGMLEAVNSVQVRPRVAGQITAIHFADGAEVKKGEALFTIDTGLYAAEEARAKGQMATATAAQQNAAQDFARAAKLIKTKAISQSEYEMKASALKQADGALESARGALRTAQVNLGYATITAPIAGKISRAEITVGNVVDPAMTNALASIVDLSPIYASFELDEQTFLNTIQGVSAAKLKTIPVEVALGSGDGAPFIAATIHSFDNQITPGSGTIRVRARLDNKDATLVPGLFARVRIGASDVAEAVLINPTAVGTDQNKKFVMGVDDKNIAQYREVTVGSMHDGLQVVTSGLKAGESIIVNGLQRARPGAPVMGSEVDMTTLAPLNASAAGAAADESAAIDKEDGK